jgi:cell filamentation protein
MARDTKKGLIMSDSTNDSPVKKQLAEAKTREEQQKADGLERGITAYRIKQIDESPIKGNYDFEHFTKVHEHIFKGLYDHAGKARDFDMHKFSPNGERGDFAHHADTRGMIDDVSKTLAGKNNLKGLDTATFVKELTPIYAKLNHAHAFEEGNGRTTQTLVSQIAREAGHDMDFAKLDRREWANASAKAIPHSRMHEGVVPYSMPIDLKPLETQLEKITKPLELEKSLVNQSHNQNQEKIMSAESTQNSNGAEKSTTSAEPKKPTATVYYGKNAGVVAQLETNSANAKGKDTALANNSQKLAELSGTKQDFNYSLETLKKSDLKELAAIKEKGFQVAVHDLSNDKRKGSDEKTNTGELKNMAESYQKAETPRAGRTYTGVIMAKGDETTVQKTATGKYVAHETANVSQLQVSDTHKNQSIKYNTEQQTEVKAVGRDEMKKAAAMEVKQSSSEGLER